MENKENESEEKQGFMQGWGLIALIIFGTIGGLVGLKALLGW
jgi:hypothetical protein